MIRSLLLDHIQAKTAALVAGGALAFSLFAVPAQAATIVINNSSCNWNAGTQTLTCDSNGGGGGGSTPVCTNLNATPSSLGAGGGTTTLTATCTNTDASTTYNWTASPPAANFSASTASNQQIPTITQTTTFTVTASNANGAGTSAASASVIVGSGGGGGGGGPISCTSAPGTQTYVVDIPWGTDAKHTLGNATGGGVHSTTPGKGDLSVFGPNDVLVVRFTVPANEPSSPVGSKNRVFANIANTSSIFGSLSDTPCDLTGSIGGSPQAGATSGPSSGTPTVYFTTSAGSPALTPGVTYYFTVINTPQPVSCAATGNCDIVFTLIKGTGQ